MLFLAFVASAAAVAFAPLYYNGEVIKESYIVVLNEDVDVATLNAMSSDFHAKFVYNIGSFKGFSGTYNEDEMMKVRSSGIVAYVEANQVARASYGEQRNPTWGLDRVDQTNLPLDSLFRFYDSAGAGVNSYVVDTGINFGHVDFAGRAVSGYDFHNGNNDAEDDNGHGTHCAGSIGGGEWGLAKNSTLIGVKVLGRLGAGSYDSVVAGVNYVAGQHQSGDKSTANMSLGGGVCAALDSAVNACVDAGVVMVVASGNDNNDACRYSPARTGGENGKAITVNAADSRDSRATFSNYGTCTDIFAPGVSVTSAWVGSSTATNTISGTSMAAPHVCGAATLILGEKGAMSPASVKSALIAGSTNGVISNPGSGSPNVNLFATYQ